MKLDLEFLFLKDSIVKFMAGLTYCIYYIEH